VANQTIRPDVLSMKYLWGSPDESYILGYINKT